MSKRITLRLTVEVSYELNGVDHKELESMLEDAANRMAGDGLFTGDTAAEVTRMSASVEATHSSRVGA